LFPNNNDVNNNFGNNYTGGELFGVQKIDNFEVFQAKKNQPNNNQ
jgi:hypothetical protein